MCVWLSTRTPLQGQTGELRRRPREHIWEKLNGLFRGMQKRSCFVLLIISPRWGTWRSFKCRVGTRSRPQASSKWISLSFLLIPFFFFSPPSVSHSFSFPFPPLSFCPLSTSPVSFSSLPSVLITTSSPHYGTVTAPNKQTMRHGRRQEDITGRRTHTRLHFCGL